jgi:DNA-binding transcriptional ArsR family regulator
VAVVREEVCNVPCFNERLVARIRAKMPSAATLEEARVLCGALADRTRLQILLALRGGDELCVCDVAHVLGTTISTASHHLRKLQDLGFLRYRNDGKMVYYSLRDRLAADIAAHAVSWPERR